MRLTRRRRLVGASVLAVLTIGVVGPAYSVWTGTGSGSGTSGTGTTLAVTLSPATPSAQLYPGAQAAVTLTVTNPNAASVRLGSLALDATQGTGGFNVDAAHAACGASSLSFTTQTNSGAGWSVAGSGSLQVTLPSSVTMSSNASNACQGAIFTVYLKAGV